MSAAEKIERPLPSERMDSAAERLKAQTAILDARKHVKAPEYMVLLADDGGTWHLLTETPIAATSRKDAISKAAKPPSDTITEPRTERFVTILSDAWVETKRTVKPLTGFEETFS